MIKMRNFFTKKNFFILAIIIPVYVALFLGLAPRDDKKYSDKELLKEMELFTDVVTIIRTEYYQAVHPKKIVYGAMDGALSSLDGYSQFLDPDSFKEMQIETRGEFGGLGIEVGMRAGALTVIAPIDGTPAQEAGIQAGDKIIRIEGRPTSDMNFMDAVKKLRGKRGTRVKLTVFRESDDSAHDFTITREIIMVKSIKAAEIIKDGVGYIKLVEFQERTPKELRGHGARLKKKGMKALILDLRNNPGGLFEVAYAVGDEFLKKGQDIVSLKGRGAGQNKVFKASGRGIFSDIPMVVIVNEGSASASEIVAGALQDNNRASVLGTKTFGKGSVQTVIPLRDGSAARLTTAAYYTPNGRSLTESGIMPDVAVELDKNIDKSAPYDNQVKEALGILEKSLRSEEWAKAGSN